MTQSLDRQLRAILRRDFSAFIEKVFYELSPGATFLPHWTIDLIAAHLELVRLGTIRRLIINQPPRSLKSIITSIAFPAMILGQDPAAEVICASYAQDLSEKFSRDTRTIMLTPWYREVYPKTLLSPNRMAAAEFETTLHGFRKATSVGGVLTGRGAAYIVLDDPTKPEEAMSKVLREGTNNWFSHTLFSRLNNKATGRIVVVMQRLSEGDLTDHLLAMGGWTVLNLAAIAQEDEEHVFHNAFGRARIIRRKGEALHPAHESLETLQSIQRHVGSSIFSAQWLQAPTPPDGIMVKREWFKRYKQADAPSNFDQVVMSIDTANKATELSDYTAITIWGVRGKNIYLLHVLRRRLNYPDLKRTVKETASQFEATTVLIEDRASGTQLIQELLADGLYSVKGIEPTGDKVMRLHAQTATIENGFVYIPEQAPWLDEFLHELTAFPNAKHDDQVDSTAQALQWLKATPEPGFLVYIREQLAAQRAKETGNYAATVGFRVPEGIWRVLTLSGRAILVPKDRTIWVSEGDADPCRQSGWERVG